MGKTKNTLEQKSHTKVTNPRGHEENSGLLSHSKPKEIHHKIFRFGTSLKNTGKKENLR
jgi:hypothetical protein